jgi:hypothetical protein
MVRRSRKQSVCVTPLRASRALHALHYAQQADNLRIEIAAARVLDAYCQGRVVAAEVITDTDAFLSATEHTGGMKYDITSLEHGFRVSAVLEASNAGWPVDDFPSLAEAYAFASRMRMIDAGVSHFSSGARLSNSRHPSVSLSLSPTREGTSPAALRDVSRVLLAHAQNLRGDAEAAPQRAVERTPEGRASRWRNARGPAHRACRSMGMGRGARGLSCFTARVPQAARASS